MSMATFGFLASSLCASHSLSSEGALVSIEGFSYGMASSLFAKAPTPETLSS